MDTKTGEIKVLSLLFCCIRQTRPIRESITGSDTIIRLSINVRLVNPYFCNLQLLHTILFLKITFPALNNNLCVLFYNSFNNCDLLFFKAMIIYLFYGAYIIFRFAIIFDNMYMYGVMII